MAIGRVVTIGVLGLVIVCSGSITFMAWKSHQALLEIEDTIETYEKQYNIAPSQQRSTGVGQTHIVLSAWTAAVMFAGSCLYLTCYLIMLRRLAKANEPCEKLKRST